MANRADLIIYQGDHYSAVVTVSGSSFSPLPPEQVIFGYAAHAQIREDFADNTDDVAVEIETAVDSPYITLTIPDTTTVDMCGDYVWDLQIISPDGITTTILRGNVRVIAEVTRGIYVIPPPIQPPDVIPSLPGAMLPGGSLPGGSAPGSLTVKGRK